MLENERYWLAQRAMLNIALHPNHGRADRETFYAMLQQHLIVQNSLQRLGLSSNYKLSSVPLINEVLLPPTKRKRSKEWKKPVAIHVIGMPKTLKTTMLDALKEIGGFQVGKKILRLRAEEEQAGVVKLLHDKRHAKTNYAEYIVSQVLINIVLATITQRAMAIDPNQVYIFNRGPIDLVPFTDANFLFGRLDIRKYSSAIFNINSNMRVFSAFRNALMVLLVEPEEALHRNVESGDLEYGRAMNPAFLPFLFEQYLTTHESAINSKRILPGLNEPVPYACVDMSGSNIEEPIGRYMTVFAGFLNYFFG